MDTAKMTTVAEYMYTHEDVARFFPRLMIRRMSWIDKLLHSACLEYSFDVIFDETEDESIMTLPPGITGKQPLWELPVQRERPRCWGS